jgi:hypothetical protein
MKEIQIVSCSEETDNHLESKYKRLYIDSTICPVYCDPSVSYIIDDSNKVYYQNIYNSGRACNAIENIDLDDFCIKDSPEISARNIKMPKSTIVHKSRYPDLWQERDGGDCSPYYVYNGEGRLKLFLEDVEKICGKEHRAAIEPLLMKYQPDRWE